MANDRSRSLRDSVDVGVEILDVIRLLRTCKLTEATLSGSTYVNHPVVF